MNKKMIVRSLVGVVVIVAAILGWMEYQKLQKFENTDDAQVDGDISPVLPKVSGFVTNIYFEDNQAVNKGDTLLRLDDKDLRLKVEQAEAALQSAKANLEVVKANSNTASASIGSAQANVDAAKARAWKAAQDFTRMQKLIEEHSITQQQFDAARAENEIATAQLEAARKQYNTVLTQETGAGDQVKVAQAVINQRETDLELARLQLSYTYITAPADGVVSKKNVQVGQLVQVAQPLCSIVSSGDMWVVANFKETQLAKMREGQEVSVSVDALDGDDIHGKVLSFSGATGAKFSLLPPDNASGNFVKVVQRIPVKIALDKNSPEYKKLKPGMSVDVSVDIENNKS
jgi:membrane fusion protein (multidrug efflux system)